MTICIIIILLELRFVSIFALLIDKSLQLCYNSIILLLALFISLCISFVVILSYHSLNYLFSKKITFLPYLMSINIKRIVSVNIAIFVKNVLSITNIARPYL